MSTRRRLSQLLLASHMGLVLLFAAMLIATGVGTIRTAIVAQARTETERSVSEARRRLDEWNRELNVAADLLAEQPTLRFYLQRGQWTKARKLVADFVATSRIEYVRVQIGERLIAQVGPAPPMLEPALAWDPQGQAWRVVRRTMRSEPDVTIIAAESLKGRLDALPSNERIALDLRPPVRPRSAGKDPWRRALEQVQNSGEPDTFEGVGGRAVARIAMVRDDDGRPAALLSAAVDPAWVQRRIVEWMASFGAFALLTGLVAFGLALLVAARISRPFAQLARDAERLGRGDLDTPVRPPQTFLSEPVALSNSLEQMRARVGTLTADERARRQELDAVLDGVDEGIVGVDPDETIHYANRQFLELVGREREAVQGLRVRDILVCEPVPSAPAEPTGGAGPALADPRPERCAVVGTLRPLVLRRLEASGGRQLLVVREENALEAGRAMRDRILANLSHEFQTPLSAQIASIEMLRDHLRAGADRAAIQLADAQYRGTMRLSQLVDNLLDSVRIESGEMRLRRQPVDLAAVVADAVELIQPLIDQREQRVETSLPSGPMLTGDAARLSSVMVNLLANANKFAPDRSTIRVELDWGPERATVWVEDEGPGLPSGRGGVDLFAPFKRSPHEEPSQRGTGLGLAVVHAIVAAHGGEVSVASGRNGRGARIGVVLPVPAPARAGALA